MKATTLKTILEMNTAGNTVSEIKKATRCSEANIMKAIEENTPALPTVDLAHNAMATVVDNINANFKPEPFVPAEEAPVTEAQADDKSAALQAMLAAATTQTKAVEEAPTKTSRKSVTLVKVAASSSKDENGNSVQRRNRNVKGRAVAVFTSESLKMCWIGTHLGFATKTAEGAMNIMRNAPQKALAPMQVAEDVQMVLEFTDVEVGAELELKKAEAFDKYQAMGYTMISRRGKAPAAVATPAPVVTETETVDTDLTAEDQADLAAQFEGAL